MVATYWADSRLTGVSTVQAEAMFEERFIYLYGGHGSRITTTGSFSFFFSFLPMHNSLPGTTLPIYAYLY